MHLVDKLILATARRLAPNLPSAFLPGLGQSVECPGMLAQSYQEIFVRGVYNPIAPLPARANVVDAGAYLGLFSIFAAARSERCRITAIEANPSTITPLRRNLDRLAARRGAQVAVVEAALAGSHGSISFFSNTKAAANLGNSAFRDVKRLPDWADFTEIEVKTLPLAEVTAEKIDFLKLDVEGAEFLVLTPEVFRPELIEQAGVEFHDLSNKAEAIERIISHALEVGYLVLTETGQPVDDIETLREAVAAEVGEAITLRFCSQDHLARAGATTH